MSEKIYRCAIPLGEFTADERTIGDLLLHRSQKFSKSVALLERNPSEKSFRSYIWQELMAEIQGLAMGLTAMGLKPGEHVALLSHNQKDMFVSLMAIYSLGAVAVPIFFGYFPEQVNYILSHSRAKVLLAADAAQVAKVGSREILRDLQRIFVMADHGIKSDPRVEAYRDLLKKVSPAQAFQECVRKTKSEDSCAIMYTSGTTGRPKGVELSHRNFISQQKAIAQVWQLSPQDRLLSYLPWHHCFGGIFESFMAIYNGIPMAIDASRGKDLELLIENWRLIKPTIYLSVPAVYQAMLREMALKPELEKVFFHKDLRFVFTAAAPLPPDIYDVYAARNIPVHEGWGLTESSPDITLTRPDKSRPPGNVGEVLPGVEIKLKEDGEILARGPNIMKGYFRDPESTRKAIDEGGWLHTGDLAQMTETGLRIVGRADGVFKLVNGEKIPSAQIEGVLVSSSKFIDRAVVLGSGKDYVTAVLFCHEKMLENWAKEKGISQKSFADLLSSDEVRALFQEDVRRANLRLETKYCRIKYFYLAPHSPSLERGELTPTAKVCRQRVMENYRDAIQCMYEKERDSSDKRYVSV